MKKRKLGHQGNLENIIKLLGVLGLGEGRKRVPGGASFEDGNIPEWTKSFNVRYPPEHSSLINSFNLIFFCFPETQQPNQTEKVDLPSFFGWRPRRIGDQRSLFRDGQLIKIIHESMRILEEENRFLQKIRVRLSSKQKFDCKMCENKVI